jgi:outer membrane protein OmpA-like peptidoglycan-associated protein
MLAGAKKATLVMIRGGTSTTTPSARDEALALSRALSARTYLVSCGVSPVNIAVGFASGTDFVADNSTKEGRSQNQRVEVELIYVPPFAEINSNASLR